MATLYKLTDRNDCTREYGNSDGQWYVADPAEGSQTMVPLEGALDKIGRINTKARRKCEYPEER